MLSVSVKKTYGCIPYFLKGNGLAASCQVFYHRIYERFLQCSLSLKKPTFNRNAVDPERTPNVASDLLLHCFPMSLSWLTMHK